MDQHVLTLIIQSVLFKGVQGKLLNESKGMNILARQITVGGIVELRDLILPKFDRNMSIQEHRALVFDSP